MDYQFSDRINCIKASAIREIFKLTADPAIISFSAGNPSPDAFPVEAIRSIVDDTLSTSPVEALQYSVTEGYPMLRDYLKTMVAERYNAFKQSDDIIITSGAQQGIDLCSKVLLNEGDTVICENPSFVGALNAIKSYRTNLVGVDLEEDGINLEQLEAAIKNNKNVKMLYLIPNFQNPSGITTSFEKRKAIYELAQKYQVLILEDNPYGELRFAGETVPTIKSLDTEGLVIYSGSFSKVLSPGIRVGFLSAPSAIISKVVVAKQVNDVHTNILSQILCYRFLKEYDFDEHLSKLRTMYRHKCDLMLEQIEKEFAPCVSHTKPEGGLFLWCTLPEQVDMMQFCKDAVTKKVAVVPGSAFLPHEETMVSHSFRLNFSMPSDEEIITGIKALGEMTHSL